jgi:hypothetical protein
MSFRRAMTVEDWRERLREAGVVGKVKDVGLGRLLVTSY